MPCGISASYTYMKCTRAGSPPIILPSSLSSLGIFMSRPTQLTNAGKKSSVGPGVVSSTHMMCDGCIQGHVCWRPPIFHCHAQCYIQLILRAGLCIRKLMTINRKPLSTLAATHTRTIRGEWRAAKLVVFEKIQNISVCGTPTRGAADGILPNESRGTALLVWHTTRPAHNALPANARTAETCRGGIRKLQKATIFE